MGDREVRGFFARNNSNSYMYMYHTKINADMTNSPSQHLNAVRNVIVFDAAVGEGEVTAVWQTPPLVHQAYHDSAPYQRQQREGHNAANRDGT